MTPARVAAIVALVVVVIALRRHRVQRRRGPQLQARLPERQPAGHRQPGADRRPPGRLGGKHRLTDDNLAEVEVSVEQELHEGTTAIVRATSLSGVANHYVSISPGPNSNPALEDGATLGLGSTTTAVDLDQFLNTFPNSVRRASANSSAATRMYPGRAQRQPGLQVLRPRPQPGRRLRARTQRRPAAVRPVRRQLQQAHHRRRPARRTALQRDLQRQHRLRRDRQPERSLQPHAALLPPVFRQSNTTFVNLRAALDDLDPLVETAKPATKDLAPFLRDLRPVLSRRFPSSGTSASPSAAPASPTTRRNCWPPCPPSSSAPRGPSRTPKRRSRPSSRTSTSSAPTRRTSSTASASSARSPATTTATATTPGSSSATSTSSSRRRRRARTDHAERTVRSLRRSAAVRRPCPGGATQPAPDGSNPFTEPPFAGSGVHPVRMQPERRATGTMRKLA